MEEELIIDESFVKKHKKDIIEFISKTLSELGLYSTADWEKLSLEQYAIYESAAQIKMLIYLIASVPQVLCDKILYKVPTQKVAYLQDTYNNETMSFIEDSIELLPYISRYPQIRNCRR